MKVMKILSKSLAGRFLLDILNEKKDVYEYDGKDVEIPFYLENQGNKKRRCSNNRIVIVCRWKCTGL